MDDLAAFCAARLDEDEARARQALQDAGRRESGEYGLGGKEWAAAMKAGWKEIGYDPARVLREVAAKRAILAAHQPYDPGPNSADCSTCDDQVIGGGAYPCPTIRHLAAVYSDHPGYRQEWQP